MKQQFFYRNVRAREQLDIFLISAIGSLLLTRFFLHITGYPQIGGGGLHIGHVLWGGLFMLVSITINLSFLGIRVQRLSALLGGIGFGVFIDEIGKYLTSDNDYFFRPTVGIIYAIFIILYLTFNFLGRKQILTSREYQLNAMAELEEAIAHNMDPLEKRRAHALLARASRRSGITLQLEQFLGSIDTVPEPEPRPLRRLLARLDRLYIGFWNKRTTRGLVRLFFVVEAAIFTLAVVCTIYFNLDDVTAVFSGKVTYGFGLLIGQFVSSLVAAGFAIAGTLRLRESRLAAFEDFRRATLINLFLTEFFVFSRLEFEALTGFLFNLAILLVITYVMHQEQRYHRSAPIIRAVSAH